MKQPKPSVILLSGVSKVGKTTLADHICARYEWVKQYALGDKVKELTFKILKLFNMPIKSIDELYDVNQKEKWRKYLQQIATECCRSTFGNDFWAEILLKPITEDVANGCTVIISDVRFRNEQEYFTQHLRDMCPVELIYIERLEVMNEDTSSVHVSERLDDIESNYRLLNNGISLEQYKTDGLNLFNEITNSDDDDHDNHNHNHNHNHNNDNDNNDNDDHDRNHNRDDHDDNDHDDLAEPYHLNDIETVERATSIIEDVRQNHINVIANIKAQSNNDKDGSAYVHESSQRIGELGESDVLKLIQIVRPDYETTLVSSNGHRGDIQAIDHVHKIRWCVEVKCKQIITKEDIDKFERDVVTIEHEEAGIRQYRVFGLFVSITSATVPVYGKFGFVHPNKLSVSRDYYNPQTLEIIFSLIERFGGVAPVPSNTVYVSYTFTPDIMSTIVQLRVELQSSTAEVQMLNDIIASETTNLTTLHELLTKQQTKHELLKWLNSMLPGAAVEQSTANIIDQERERMITYISTTPANRIKRRELETKFPSQKAELSKYKTMRDIIEEFTDPNQVPPPPPPKSGAQKRGRPRKTATKAETSNESAEAK